MILTLPLKLAFKYNMSVKKSSDICSTVFYWGFIVSTVTNLDIVSNRFDQFHQHISILNRCLSVFTFDFIRFFIHPKQTLHFSQTWIKSSVKYFCPFSVTERTIKTFQRMKKKYQVTWCLLRGKVCPGCFAFFFLSILEPFNLFFFTRTLKT